MELVLKEYGSDGRLSVDLLKTDGGSVIVRVAECPAGIDGALIPDKDGGYSREVWQSQTRPVGPLLQEAVRLCDIEYALYKSMPTEKRLTVARNGKTGQVSVTYTVWRGRAYGQINVIKMPQDMCDALDAAALKYFPDGAFSIMYLTPGRDNWADVERDVLIILAWAGLVITPPDES